MAKFKVLSTKKLDASLVETAKENGIEIIEQEFIRIHTILTKEKWDEIFHIIQNKIECAVFTSSNAVHSIKKYLTDYVNPFETNWKIFCLAGKTKTVLDENIEVFGKIAETAENASTLAEKIIQNEIEEITFFCGNKRRDELPGILKKAGIKVQEVIVYETMETPIVITDHFDAVLFFSPSAAQSFFSVNQLMKGAVCFAIGQTTANSIADFTNNKIIISESPSQATMLSSVQFCLENSNCYK